MSTFTLYDATLGTLDLSHDNGYLIEEFDAGSPDVRSAVYDRPGSHGVADESRFFGARTINIGGKLKATSSRTRDDIQQRLMAYLLPNKRPMLRWTRDGITREITVRVDRLSQKVQFAVDDFNISWRAEPFWRGMLLKEVPVPFTNVTTLEGVSFNWSFDITFGSGSGTISEVEVTNSGVVETFPNIIIYGDANFPTIENLTTQKKLKVNVSMNPDDTLEIDTYRHTIIYNSTSDVFSEIDFDVSSWWNLQSGVNRIKLTAETLPSGAPPFAVLRYTELFM